LTNAGYRLLRAVISWWYSPRKRYDVRPLGRGECLVVRAYSGVFALVGADELAEVLDLDAPCEAGVTQGLRVLGTVQDHLEPSRGHLRGGIDAEIDDAGTFGVRAGMDDDEHGGARLRTRSSSAFAASCSPSGPAPAPVETSSPEVRAAAVREARMSEVLRRRLNGMR